MSSYYNPETKEVLELKKLKKHINASISQERDIVFGWYKIIEDTPLNDKDHKSVLDEIKYMESDKMYHQTYKTYDIVDDTIEDNDEYKAVENGIIFNEEDQKYHRIYALIKR